MQHAASSRGAYQAKDAVGCGWLKPSKQPIKKLPVGSLLACLCFLSLAELLGAGRVFVGLFWCFSFFAGLSAFLALFILTN